MLLIHACPTCHGNVDAGYACDDTIHFTCQLANCVLSADDHHAIVTRLRTRELGWQFVTVQSPDDTPLVVPSLFQPVTVSA